MLFLLSFILVACDGLQFYLCIYHENVKNALELANQSVQCIG